MSAPQFVTAINCMDGRVQRPVFNWMEEKYGAPYVDMITEAGPNKFLLNGSEEQIEAIKAKLQISVENHGSNVIAIAGHHDCAGNPAAEDEKKTMIKQAVELIASWGFSADVIGLYVNENWEVESVVS